MAVPIALFCFVITMATCNHIENYFFAINGTKLAHLELSKMIKGFNTRCAVVASDAMTVVS